MMFLFNRGRACQSQGECASIDTWVPTCSLLHAQRLGIRWRFHGHVDFFAAVWPVYSTCWCKSHSPCGAGVDGAFRYCLQHDRVLMGYLGMIRHRVVVNVNGRRSPESTGIKSGPDSSIEKAPAVSWTRGSNNRPSLSALYEGQMGTAHLCHTVSNAPFEYHPNGIVACSVRGPRSDEESDSSFSVWLSRIRGSESTMSSGPIAGKF